MPLVLRNISLWIVIFVLAWSPLVYASNRLTLWFFNGSLISLAFLIYASSIFFIPSDMSLHKIRTVSWLFILVLVWIGIQWLPLDIDSITHPSWMLASQALNESIPSRITVSPIHTQYSVVPLITNGILFWLVMQFSASGKSRKILFALCLISSLYIFFAFLCWLFDMKTVLWHPNASGYGTFVNVNMLVIYSIMAVLLTLYFLFERIRRLAKQRYIVGIVDWMNFITGGLNVVVYFYVFLLCLFSCMILVSGSRGGLFLYLLSFTLFIAFFIIKNRSSMIVYGVFVVFLGFLFTVSGLLSSQASDRFFLYGIIDEKRVSLYKSALNIIQDHFLFGTGYGSFQVIFPLYRDVSYYWNAHYDKLHNTPLELMLELGVPVGFILLLCVLIPFWSVIKAFGKSKKHSVIFIFVIVMSVFVFIQSLIYFHIQIQAIAFFYLTILAIGYEKSMRRRIK